MEHDDLVARVVSFLMDRKYEAGERVPSERELATRFDVSRGQMRETLSVLQALRVVERRAKSGLFMATGTPSLDALALFAQIGVPLTSADVQQSVEMRRIHELEAVRLACERRTQLNLDQMAKILQLGDDGIAAGGLAGERAGELDRLFHSEIVRATQNDVFLRIVDIFYLMTVQRRAHYFTDEERFRQSHAEHRMIYQAIEQRDVARAVDLVGGHLRGVDSYWGKLIEGGHAATSTPAEVRSNGHPDGLADTAAQP